MLTQFLTAYKWVFYHSTALKHKNMRLRKKPRLFDNRMRRASASSTHLLWLIDSAKKHQSIASRRSQAIEKRTLIALFIGKNPG
jgi:hypothetical protein